MVQYSFEWDGDKDTLNQQRHGVAFVDAQELSMIGTGLLLETRPIQKTSLDSFA